MNLRRRWLLLLAALMLLCSLPMAVSANSAEPPGMIIITTGLPEDAELTLIIPGSDTQPEVRTYRVDKIWESQYRLYYHFDMDTLEKAGLLVTIGEESFLCSLPDGVDGSYSNILTLDYNAQTLTLGLNPWRPLMLTTLRIALTLLIEGLIFFLFGFRSKRSWIVFFIINLLTQGFLNLMITFYAFSGSYWILLYFLMEILIFAVESILLPLFTREKKWWVTVIYAQIANAASLAAGILIISYLPI